MQNFLNSLSIERAYTERKVVRMMKRQICIIASSGSNSIKAVNVVTQSVLGTHRHVTCYLSYLRAGVILVWGQVVVFNRHFDGSSVPTQLQHRSNL
jgi:hypothetical protein